MSGENSCLVQSYRTIKTLPTLFPGFDMPFEILIHSDNILQVNTPQPGSFKYLLSYKLPLLSTLGKCFQ